MGDYLLVLSSEDGELERVYMATMSDAVTEMFRLQFGKYWNYKKEISVDIRNVSEER